MVKQKSRGIASLPKVKRFDEGGEGDAYQYTEGDYSNPPSWALPEDGVDQSDAETERLARLNAGQDTVSGGGNVTDDNQTAAETNRLARLNEVKAADPDLWTKLSKLPGQMVDKYLGSHTKNGVLDIMGIGKDLLALGAGVAAYNQAGQPTPKTGYQGKIPKYTAVQGRADDPGAGFREGQGGHQYFTGLNFAKEGDAAGLAALQAANATELSNLNAANKARAAAYTAAHPAYVDKDPTGDKFFGRTDKTDLVPNTTKPFTNATVPSGTGSDTLPGGTGVSTVVGGTGNDTVKGGGGADAITEIYRKYLGKEPDAEGLAYWTSKFGNFVDTNELNTFLGTASDLLKNNPNNIDYKVDKERADALLGNKDWATSHKNELDQFSGTIKDLLSSGKEDEAKSLYNEKQRLYGFSDEAISPFIDKAQFTGSQIGQWKGAQKDVAAPVNDVSIPEKDFEKSDIGSDYLLKPDLPLVALADTNTSKFNDEGMVAPSLNAKPGESVVGGGIAALTGNALPEYTPTLNRQFMGSDKFDRGLEDSTMYMARGGSTSPRGTYLQGHTDGMADKIPGTIDGIQPARLAHGEFVVPADVVSHLGNGNSDAGAKQLYKMMDKIRMARTGTKDQGKRINPNKFMPGGLASIQGYNKGGVIRFEAGATVPAGVIGTEQGLSDWAGDYTTDMMAKAQALVNQKLAKPDVYTGQLSAGDSALQQQAYANAAKLAVPTSIGTAANTAGDLAGKMANLSYSPTTVQSAYTAPQNLGYTAEKATAASFAKPEDIAAERVSSGPALTAFQMQAAQSGYAPSLTNYQAAAPAAVKTEKFIDPGTAQAYMSPFMQQVVENQQRDAQRKADIESTTRHAGATQAGAFGGSRQAIMDAEAARNLAIQKGDIQAQGAQNAFTNAQQQFNAEQGYGLQGQIANQGAGVTVGGQNLNANLATQQLGAQTGIQVALANLNNQQQAAVQNQASQLQAQGMTAQQALQAAMANQSTGLQAAQANQGMAYNTAAQNAQLAQQTALANQAAANQAGQFGAGQNLASAQTAAQYGQAANALNAQNAQFGAQYGLNALQGSLGAAQAQGQLGTAQNQAGLANLSAQLGAGNQQQATTQAGITAQKAAFDEQKMDPYNQINFQNSLLAGKPIASTSYNFQNNPLTAAAGAASTVKTAVGG